MWTLSPPTPATALAAARHTPAVRTATVSFATDITTIYTRATIAAPPTLRSPDATLYASKSIAFVVRVDVATSTASRSDGATAASPNAITTTVSSTAVCIFAFAATKSVSSGAICVSSGDASAIIGLR